MALYQIFDDSKPLPVAQPEQFDDGLNYQPGEDDYSTEAVEAKCAELGKGFTYSLIGVPGWHERTHAEEEEKLQAEKDAFTKECEARDAAAAAAETEAANAAAKAKAEAQAEAVAAHVADQLRKAKDPEGYARDQARAHVNARYDAMASVSIDPDTLAGIETLREIELKQHDAPAADG